MCILCTRLTGMTKLVGDVMGKLLDFTENARFENFAESIFEKEVSGNALNLHYSLAYPEKQGISRPRATLGKIHPNNEKASAQCQEYVKKLKKFSQSKLSTSNRLTLDLLLLYYHTEASLGDNYLLEEHGIGPECVPEFRRT